MSFLIVIRPAELDKTIIFQEIEGNSSFGQCFFVI